MEDLQEDPYKEYIREQEPAKEKLEYAWSITSTLKNLDGLEMSEYLQAAALSNIKGEKTLEEVTHEIEAYYADRKDDDYREADLVSLRTAILFSENAFSFCVPQYIGIHRYLYTGIYANAGKVNSCRKFGKQQLQSGTYMVNNPYMDQINILEHVFSHERRLNYSQCDIADRNSHLLEFVCRLWQIYAFSEGNNRTNAVFLQKYVQSIGININEGLNHFYLKLFFNTTTNM